MTRLGNFIAVMVMVAASRWRESTLATVLVYVAFGYILIDLLLRARAGYVRRLPHWTRESWRRYFIVCAVFGTVLLAFICMAAAVEFRLPITGAANSAARLTWIAFLITFMLIGTLGLSSAVFWLHEGEPSEQFKRFQRYFAART